jgi:formylglycine-generating enzyme required for sulfatase activity
MNKAAGLLMIAFASCAEAAGEARNAGAFRDARFAPRMVIVPAGSALLGSDEQETRREGRTPAFAAWERPRRDARFSKPFAVGKHHVTRGEYRVFLKATGRVQDGCLVAVAGKWSDGPVAGRSPDKVGFTQRDDEPALCVNWSDANAYAEWLSKQTGRRYRLLTEAEWEYAARGGTQAARWWGNDVASLCTRANGGDRAYAAKMPDDNTANLGCSDGFAFTSPVGWFRPNPFGLHDMIGNAWQWVADCFTAIPGAAPPAEPCEARSIRGGSWHNSASTLRPAARFRLPPDMRSSSIGFRVMRELD